MSQSTIEWYFVGPDGSQQGPHTRESLLSMFSVTKLSARSLVWSPGMEGWQPFSTAFKDSLPPPIPSTSGPPPVLPRHPTPQPPLTHPGVVSPFEQPPYFSVSPTKLIVMTLCTFGLYEFFWFYKHWNQLRVTGRQKVLPVFRAMFAIFTCHSLFRRIKQEAGSYGLQATFSPGWLATAYIVPSVLCYLLSRARAPGPVLLLLSFAPLAALIPVQRVANSLNAHVTPGVNPNDRFTGANITFIIIGGILWLPLIIRILSSSHQ
jgi:GYF domain 2